MNDKIEEISVQENLNKIIQKQIVENSVTINKGDVEVVIHNTDIDFGEGTITRIMMPPVISFDKIDDFVECLQEVKKICEEKKWDVLVTNVPPPLPPVIPIFEKI